MLKNIFSLNIHLKFTVDILTLTMTCAEFQNITGKEMERKRKEVSMRCIILCL